MAMGRPKAVLVLSPEQRAQLESMASSRWLPAGLHDELRPGRPRPISDERVAQLVRKTLETKAKGGTQGVCGKSQPAFEIHGAGRNTLLTPTAGLPATRNSFAVVLTTSGLATGCASGTAPGHIGTCICPGDGCPAGVWAFRPPNANTRQRPQRKGFIKILTAYR